MKKKIFGLALMMGFSLCSYPQITFQKSYAGILGDVGIKALQTNDGGYIIAGITTSFGAVDQDFLLIKTNSFGDTLWTRTYGGGNIEVLYGISLTSDSGYILSGSTQSFGAGSIDLYLIKTDGIGNTLWSKCFGNVNFNRGYSVSETSDSCYIVTAILKNPFSGKYYTGLIKTDINGNTIWIKEIRAALDYICYSGLETFDGGYILTGEADNSITTQPDVLIVKTDSSGNYQWSKTFGGIGYDVGYYIQQTTDSGYIIAGKTNSFGAGLQDIYLIKTDLNGNMVWAKTYGGTNEDYLSSIELLVGGGFIVTGFTYSFGMGNSDAYLINTNNVGDPILTKTFGGITLERAYSGCQTADGGYLLTGSNVITNGNPEVYLIKTDSLGNSGCSESTTTTIVTIPATQVSIIAASSNAATLIETTPVTIVGTAGFVTTSCATTGTNHLSNHQSQISIFPNPSSGVFTISFPDNFINGEVEVYSIVGEKVFSDKINTSTTKEFNLRNIVPGIYFVKVFDGEKSYCKKLIIE